ncbi:hypothetical protein ARMGADRAFT_126196 [Armillaria gallica]|uniref:Uncharacterized protein n=1 Tax=Armillaria gallica TaxID=47427 RepID=A0A2H3DYT2_ARMGA|nr:hypothetical protein ARMGADRAFT_126196 [Armillaria gallica]
MPSPNACKTLARHDSGLACTVVAFAIPRHIHAPGLSSASILYTASKLAVYGTNVCPTFSGDVTKTTENETKSEGANNRFRARGSILKTNDAKVCTQVGHMICRCQ